MEQRGRAMKRRVAESWKGMSVVHVAEWWGVWWNLICCLLSALHPLCSECEWSRGVDGVVGRGGDACAGKLNSAPPSAVSSLLCSLACLVALYSVTLMSCQLIGKAPGPCSLWLWFNLVILEFQFQTICLAFPQPCTCSLLAPFFDLKKKAPKNHAALWCDLQLTCFYFK